MTYQPDKLDRLATAILAAALREATTVHSTKDVQNWCLTTGCVWADALGDGLNGDMIRDLRRRGWRRVGSERMEDVR
jgi:uncharacterized lipoprotein YmbA